MTTEITQFSEVDNAIAILQDKYAVVPDCSTEEGFDAAKEGHKDIRSYQIKLEKTKLKLTEKYRKKTKKVNASATDIDGRLDKIGLPFKAAIDKQKEKLAEIEAKRITDLQDEIATFQGFVSDADGKSSVDISSIIESVDFIEVDEHFQEFQTEAREILNTVKAKLSEMLALKVQSEIDEKKAAELKAENDKLLEEQKATKNKLIERNKEIIKDKMMGYEYLIDDIDQLVEMDTYDLSVLLQERIDAEIVRVAQSEEEDDSVVIKDNLEPLGSISEDITSLSGITIKSQGHKKDDPDCSVEETGKSHLSLKDAVNEWATGWGIEMPAIQELSAILKERGLI